MQKMACGYRTDEASTAELTFSQTERKGVAGVEGSCKMVSSGNRKSRQRKAAQTACFV